MYLFGTLVCRGKGGRTERFLNLCRHHGIPIWKVECKDRILTFRMRQKDYKKMVRFVPKTHVCPRIIERHGLPFFLQRMEKDWTFYVGFFFFWGVLIFLSTYIWGMEFEGQQYYAKETISREIASMNMGVGTKRKHLNCDEIEKHLREKYAKLSWVSAEEAGCMLRIKVKEGSAIGEEKKAESGHVIALVSGVVKKIVTRQGTAMVKAGQKVKKGDVLIQGVVDYTNDAGEIYRKQAVCAEGEVLIESEKTFQEIWEKEKTERVHIGEPIQVLRIQWGNVGFSIKNPLKRLDNSVNYDILSYVCFEDGDFSLFGSKKMYYQTEKKRVPYSREQAEAILKKHFLNWCQSLQERGYQVLDQSWDVSTQAEGYKGNGVIRFQTDKMGFQKMSLEEQSQQDERKDEKDGTKSNHS